MRIFVSSPRRAVRALLLLGAMLLVSAAFAQQRPATIRLEELRTGMRGYGLSVFSGTEPERFDVEVIDVLHGFRPDQDLILVRTPHPLLNHTRAVGGMSGSPIYIDGRLAGAYAYGWQFGLDPVIGVTPIHNMLQEMDRPTRPDSFPGAQPLVAQRRRRGARRTGATRNRAPADAGGAFSALRSQRPTSLPEGMERVATPLMLGGFNEDAVALLRRELEPHGLVALQGGGSGRSRSQEAAPSYVDGGAIGVQLIRGDVAATAIGTVTHVGPGQRLVAFGHPMMNGGEVGLPTTTARVVHVLASAARSFKIAEAVTPFGTLVHDRQAAIVVDTGLTPATIPVRLRLSGLADPPRSEWNMRVASSPGLTPMLLFGAMVNAIKVSSSDETDVTYRARYTVEIEGHAPVTLEDHGYMGSGPADPRALSRLRLFDLMEIAYANPFQPSRLLSVDMELDIRFADEVLRIVDASTESATVEPGANVPVRVRLRRYGEGDRFRTVRVHIPERAAGQTIQLRLRSGADVRRAEAVARNMADLVAATTRQQSATEMVASLRLGSRGVRFPGHVTDSLPRSVLDSLQLTAGEGPGRPFVTEVHQTFDGDEVLAGSATLSLRVRAVPEEHRR